MSLQDNVAAYIRAVMKRDNKTLAEFSEELDISRNSLYAYSNGEGNPTITTLEHIAEKMGVNPASILLGVFDLDQSEIAMLLLETIQNVADLPEEKRLRFAELFLEMVKLWNKGVTARPARLFRVPMQVREMILYHSGGAFPVCPQCGCAMEREYQRYCDRCGQRLGWREFHRASVTVRPCGSGQNP